MASKRMLPETLGANFGPSIPTGWRSDILSTPDFSLLAGHGGGDGHWHRLRVPAVTRALQHVEYYSLVSQDPKAAVRDYWTRLVGGGTFCDVALGFVCDVGPPLFIDSFRAAEASKNHSTGRSGSTRESWYPTLAMGMQTKKQLPASGIEWLRLRLQTKLLQNGLLDVEVLIHDELGDLIAISHHVVIVVDIGLKIQQGAGKRHTCRILKLRAFGSIVTRGLHPSCFASRPKQDLEQRVWHRVHFTEDTGIQN
ncbi:hypothetical protein PWT90_08816 [Aphanocladium album]|nr:hypothetical protein PWT90_08816 [Aphanocladium album]